MLPIDGGASVDGGDEEDPSVVRLSIDGEPGHLNPDIDPDRWGFRLSHDLVYEPLVRALPDGTYAPVLADRFSVDPGGERRLGDDQRQFSGSSHRITAAIREIANFPAATCRA